MREQRVDHHVAGADDAVFGNALAAQVCVRRFIGGEEIIRDRIGAESVDLFRHRHVEGAQAGLDMGNTDAEFLRGQRTGKRGSLRLPPPRPHRA